MTRANLAALPIYAYVFIAVLLIGFYLVGAYARFRIGRSCDIGSFGAFSIPVYSTVLLCRCGRISAWTVAGLVLPLVAFGAALLLLAGEVLWYVGIVLLMVFIGFRFYLWGSVARRLSKDFWLYGLLTSLFVFPLLFLAFGTSRSVKAPSPPWLPEAREASYSLIAEASSDDDLIDVNGLRLFCVEGTYGGLSLDLPHDGIVIGRDPARAHLVLTASEVSGMHARVAPDPYDVHRFVVKDLNSQNGTFCEASNWSAQGETTWSRISGTARMDRGTRFKIGDNVFLVR